MNTVALRTFLAWAGVWLAFAGFMAHAVYGVYLEHRLAAYRGGDRLPKTERWNPAHYTSEAQPWLTRDRRWQRWRNAVWLGAIAIGNAWYLLLKP